MAILEGGFWDAFNVHTIIEWGGLLLVLVIIYIETGFFLGFVVPGGDYMLFAAGIFCGTQYLELPVFWLVVLLVLASYLGDLTGYFRGKWLGGKLFTDNKSRFFKIEYLKKGKKFYDRYGMRAFILGRFLPVIRTLVPMIAGASAFSFRKFLFFDAMGAIAWVGSLVPLGYFLGKAYPGIIDYSLYILLLFAAIASYPVIRMLFFKTKKRMTKKK